MQIHLGDTSSTIPALSPEPGTEALCAHTHVQPSKNSSCFSYLQQYLVLSILPSARPNYLRSFYRYAAKLATRPAARIPPKAVGAGAAPVLVAELIPAVMVIGMYVTFPDSSVAEVVHVVVFEPASPVAVDVI